MAMLPANSWTEATIQGSCLSDKIKLLSVLPPHGCGKTAAAGAAVNNRGEVVGASILADEKSMHSYVWTKEAGMLDTGTIGSDLSAYPTAINDSGQVVGGSCDTDFTGNCRATVHGIEVER